MDDKDLTKKGIDHSIEGKANQFKGKVKDTAGALTDDLGLQAEGKVDKMKGKFQDSLGKAERDLDREADRIRDEEEEER